MAFTHLVTPEETLASIAERFYGDIKNERFLAAANRLNAEGGSPIVPGMRLEVPAPSYYRVQTGDTWKSLAQRFLGSHHRADFLATTNHSKLWEATEVGAEILIPYNLRIIVSRWDNLVTLSQRFWNNKRRAWKLGLYNKIKKVRHRDTLLIPLTQITLTEAGKKAALISAQLDRSKGFGSIRELQQRVRLDLPKLMESMKTGSFVDVVAQSNRFLASGILTQTQESLIQRQLVDAYAALGADDMAKTACSAWQRLSPDQQLPHQSVSPKIRQLCPQTANSPEASSHSN